MKRILCLALLFSLSGPLIAQNSFVNKVDVQGKGNKRMPWYKRLRQFHLDYYESVSEPHYNRYSSRLFLHFTPNRDAEWPVFPLSRGGTGNDLTSMIALRDKETGKEYRFTDGPGIPIDGGGIVLDNFGGEIRLQLDFEALPQSVKSFDVLFNGQVWFPNVKIDPAKNDDLNRGEYVFGKVSVYKTGYGTADVYVNGRLAGWVNGVFYEPGAVLSKCGDMGTLTIALSSDKIDGSVSLYAETQKGQGLPIRTWATEAKPRPSSWFSCNYTSFN